MPKRLARTLTVAGLTLVIAGLAACAPLGGDSTPPEDAGFDATMDAAATDGRASASDSTASGDARDSGDANADVEADACWMCGGQCVDVLTDPGNCGACGNSCLASYECQRGACVPPPVVIVNASASLHAIRLCWLPGYSPLGDVAFPPSRSPMPASNYAGIPVGGAAWLDAPQIASAVSGAELYAVDALALANLANPDTPCSSLICQSCTPGGQHVGHLDAGTIRAGVVNVVAIEGCLGWGGDAGDGGDPTANAARCGPTWDAGAGNLRPLPLAIANSHSDPDAGLWSVQAAQLSPGLASLIGDAGTALVTYGTDAGSDAGPFAQLTGEGTIDPPLPAMLTAPSALSQFGQLGFAVTVQGVDAGGAGQLWMSLAQAAQLVAPTRDPTVYYGSSGTYLVAILGDPMVQAFPADAGYNSAGLHVLVLPPTAP